MTNLCDEKARLVKEYELATVAFSEAVSLLQRRMGTSAKKEYASLARAADETRVKSEKTRLALEQHIVSHGC
jgi:hypothetical protein